MIPLNILFVYFQATIPQFKGGRHAKNPIMSADQQHSKIRSSSKAGKKYNVFDTDYVANCSPFPFKDVSSRAAKLGIQPGKRTYRN